MTQTLNTPASKDLLELDGLLSRLVELYEQVYVRGPLEQVLGADEEVSTSQLRTLRFLQAEGGAWIGDIASGLGISYPAATKAVDRLYERGLAERIRDGSDARRIRVGLTHRGFQVLEEVTEVRLGRLEAALEGLNTAGLASLLEEFSKASRG